MHAYIIALFPDLNSSLTYSFERIQKKKAAKGEEGLVKLPCEHHNLLLLLLFFFFQGRPDIPSKLLTKQKASKLYLSSDKAESKH